MDRHSAFIRKIAVPFALCVLQGCDPGANSTSGDPVTDGGSRRLPTAATGEKVLAGWMLGPDANEIHLAYRENGQVRARLICTDDSGDLVINIPGFQAVGSEERMTFGSDGNVETAVADYRGDPVRGGVTGRIPVPDNLDMLISSEISVNYGSQTFTSGSAPDSEQVRNFVRACDQSEARPRPSPPQASACLLQDGKSLRTGSFRALGTEPFWNARVEGRCVTYSHPEDMAGTRVWTRFEPRSDGGRWSGALDGRLLQLTIRPKRGCSDGMSDRTYPYEATISVDGEKRKGCAENL